MTRGRGLTLYGVAVLGLLEGCNWRDGAGWRFYALVAPCFVLASVVLAALVLCALDAARRSDAAGPGWENCNGCNYQKEKAHMCLKCGSHGSAARRTKPLSRREQTAVERAIQRLNLEELERRQQ